MPEKPGHLYEFGEFRLDCAERVLLRAGQAVPLTPKAFDLLVALVERPGRLLEKETLFKAVWPDSFVEDNNLADNIFRIRKALGEGENGQKFIETLPKRGYRFTAEVVKIAVVPEVDPDVAAVPIRRIGWTAKALLAVAGMVVVLIAGTATVYSWANKRAEVSRLESLGNLYLGHGTEADVRKALEYFQRAASLDSDSSSAFCGLSVSWNFLADHYVAPHQAMPEAKAAAVVALQLNEHSSQAHVSMGVVKMQYEWDWAGAEREFQRAMSLDGVSGMGQRLYAWELMALGRFAEAQTLLNNTLENAPRDGFNHWELGLAYYLARQPEQAMEQYRRSMALEPRSYWPHMLLGWVHAQQGRHKEAADALRTAQTLNDSPQVAASIAYANALGGRRDEARLVLAKLLEMGRHKYVSPYDVATVYAGLGDNEQTLAWLEKAYEDRSGWMAWWLKVDPKFDGVRADPKFRQILRRVGHTP